MVNKVTAKSTDHPTKEDLVNELMTNPYTFHHVTKSHMSFNGAFQEPEKFLPFAAKYIVNMKSQGVLIKEDKESWALWGKEDEAEERRLEAPDLSQAFLL